MLAGCGDVATSTAIPPTQTPAATATPAPPPTATPLPTATPDIIATVSAISTATAVAQATATSNALATATAQTQATATAAAQATINYQATIAALPKPKTFTGNGNKVITGITLSKGIARITGNYKGSSNFIVKFMTSSGDLIAYPLNAIGNYSGVQYVAVEATSDYAMEIQSSGAWTIEVADIANVKAEGYLTGPYKGSGDFAFIMEVPKSGLSIFKSSYNGKSNFIITIMSASDGSMMALLANAIGVYQGEKSQKIDKGYYFVNIKAQGDWTLEIS